MINRGVFQVRNSISHLFALLIDNSPYFAEKKFNKKIKIKKKERKKRETSSSKAINLLLKRTHDSAIN